MHNTQQACRSSNRTQTPDTKKSGWRVFFVKRHKEKTQIAFLCEGRLGNGLSYRPRVGRSRVFKGVCWIPASLRTTVLPALGGMAKDMQDGRWMTARRANASERFSKTISFWLTCWVAVHVRPLWSEIIAGCYK